MYHLEAHWRILGDHEAELMLGTLCRCSPKGRDVMIKDLDLHSRSRVRARACTFCKSLGQPGFYSLTFAHKIRFLEVWFPRIHKKDNRCRKRQR